MGSSGIISAFFTLALTSGGDSALTNQQAEELDLAQRATLKVGCVPDIPRSAWFRLTASRGAFAEPDGKLGISTRVSERLSSSGPARQQPASRSRHCSSAARLLYVGTHAQSTDYSSVSVEGRGAQRKSHSRPHHLPQQECARASSAAVVRVRGAERSVGSLADRRKEKSLCAILQARRRGSCRGTGVRLKEEASASPTPLPSSLPRSFTNLLGPPTALLLLHACETPATNKSRTLRHATLPCLALPCLSYSSVCKSERCALLLTACFTLPANRHPPRARHLPLFFLLLASCQPLPPPVTRARAICLPACLLACPPARPPARLSLPAACFARFAVLPCRCSVLH